MQQIAQDLRQASLVAIDPEGLGSGVYLEIDTFLGKERAMILCRAPYQIAEIQPFALQRDFAPRDARHI